MSTAPHDVRGRWLSSLAPRTTTLSFSRGIATIELAAIVAVTLVMIAVAASAFRTYAARQEVRASLTVVAPVQRLVTHAFARSGVAPASEPDVPVLESAMPQFPSIQTVTIEHGRIEIRFGDAADESLRGRSVHLTPFQTVGGEIIWLCGNRLAGVGLYPLGFFGGTHPPAQRTTTVEPRYLPAECR